MSKHFKKVKGYYDSGLWSIERVRNAVVKGWITAEEFKMITGEVYGDDDSTTAIMVCRLCLKPLILLLGTRLFS